MSYLNLQGLRLMLADDHAAVRMGFRLLFESVDAQVVGEAACGEAVPDAYGHLRPDVLVMDVTMPGLGGLGALERLLARYPDARVLMLSAHEDSQIPGRALKAGALGYVSKSADPGELVRAVARVAQGQRHIDPALAPSLALAHLEPHPADQLTDKEFRVFLHLARGDSVQDIARQQHLSTSTIGTHLYHIKQKLQARNAAELTLIALKAGLLEGVGS